MSTKVTTGKVRLSYVHLFTPYANNPGQEAKYSVSVIIPKKDKKTLTAIADAVAEAVEAGKTKTWGGKIPARLKKPLRDGDEEHPDDPVYADCFFFNASTKTKPGVVDRNLQIILDPEEVYSGCYGRVNVNFYPYDASGNKGVAAGLNHVQKLADGEPLAGRGITANEAFADAYEDEDDEDLFD